MTTEKKEPSSSPVKTAFRAAAAAGAASPWAASASTGLALGSFSFAAPWVLLGLAALPVLWWLMRTVPPKPVRQPFPAIRFLFRLKADEQQSVHMPLWHRVLRLTAAATAIIGLAFPRFNPIEPLEGAGPVMLVIDNGWASAKNWETRTAEMKSMIDRAEKEGRPVILLPTAPPEDGASMRIDGPMAAAQARDILSKMEPQPWPSDRAAALTSAKGIEIQGSNASVVWLSDGLAGKDDTSFARRLQDLGKVTLLEDKPQLSARLAAPTKNGDALAVSVFRAHADQPDSLTLIAYDASGNVLKQTSASFTIGQKETSAAFDLPADMRGQIVRISIDGENSAGGTVLVDFQWQRRTVGIVTTDTTKDSQPLLNDAGYIRAALSPYADIQEGSTVKILNGKPSLVILDDSVLIDSSSRAKIESWIRDGGTLLRFAGPRLAARSAGQNDNLLPVRLLPGSRDMTAPLSGGKPGKVAPFEKTSPFHGANIASDIAISRMILPEPSPELDDLTWARLEDGTPLVTAKRIGQGWVVLVHTAANPEWSNLPLSGTFVDMMRAAVASSRGMPSEPENLTAALPPWRVLGGRGQLTAPSPAAQPLTGADIKTGNTGPAHPPGFYGAEGARFAYNLAVAVPVPEPLGTLPAGVSRGYYNVKERETDLTGPLLAAGFSLALIDLLVLLSQQGGVPGLRRRPALPAPAPQRA